jgi:nucleoside-diphosphate-sugar epimerase
MSSNYHKKRILVTGGAGFIGSHLTEKLIGLGADVSLITRPTTDLWRIKDFEEGVRIFPHDFDQESELCRILEETRPEIVFNLMAEVDARREPELVRRMVTNNFMNTLRLVEALRHSNGFEFFVNVGTCEEYGDGDAPFSESQRESPVSPYSLSKTLSTHLFSYLGRIEKLPCLTLRPFLTYGPRQVNNQLVPYVIRSLLKGEEINLTGMGQTRDFVYVGDVVGALLSAPFSKAKSGEVINIGSGKETKVREVIKMLQDLTGNDSRVKTDLPYRRGENMSFYCSNERAKKLLGWSNKTELRQGLKRTVMWYQSHLENGQRRNT